MFHSDGRLQRARSAFACLINSVVIADTSADIHRFATGSHTTSHPRTESIAIASPTSLNAGGIVTALRAGGRRDNTLARPNTGIGGLAHQVAQFVGTIEEFAVPMEARLL